MALLACGLGDSTRFVFSEFIHEKLPARALLRYVFAVDDCGSARINRKPKSNQSLSEAVRRTSQQTSLSRVILWSQTTATAPRTILLLRTASVDTSKSMITRTGRDARTSRAAARAAVAASQETAQTAPSIGAALRSKTKRRSTRSPSRESKRARHNPKVFFLPTTRNKKHLKTLPSDDSTTAQSTAKSPLPPATTAHTITPSVIAEDPPPLPSWVRRTRHGGTRPAITTTHPTNATHPAKTRPKPGVHPYVQPPHDVETGSVEVKKTSHNEIQQPNHQSLKRPVKPFRVDPRRVVPPRSVKVNSVQKKQKQKEQITTTTRANRSLRTRIQATEDGKQISRATVSLESEEGSHGNSVASSIADDRPKTPPVASELSKAPRRSTRKESSESKQGNRNGIPHQDGLQRKPAVRRRRESPDRRSEKKLPGSKVFARGRPKECIPAESSKQSVDSLDFDDGTEPDALDFHGNVANPKAASPSAAANHSKSTGRQPRSPVGRTGVIPKIVQGVNEGPSFDRNVSSGAISSNVQIPNKELRLDEAGSVVDVVDLTADSDEEENATNQRAGPNHHEEHPNTDVDVTVDPEEGDSANQHTSHTPVNANGSLLDRPSLSRNGTQGSKRDTQNSPTQNREKREARCRKKTNSQSAKAQLRNGVWSLPMERSDRGKTKLSSQVQQLNRATILGAAEKASRSSEETIPQSGMASKATIRSDADHRKLPARNRRLGEPYVESEKKNQSSESQVPRTVVLFHSTQATDEVQPRHIPAENQPDHEQRVSSERSSSRVEKDPRGGIRLANHLESKKQGHSEVEGASQKVARLHPGKDIREDQQVSRAHSRSNHTERETGNMVCNTEGRDALHSEVRLRSTQAASVGKQNVDKGNKDRSACFRHDVVAQTGSKISRGSSDQKQRLSSAQSQRNQKDWATGNLSSPAAGKAPPYNGIRIRPMQATDESIQDADVDNRKLPAQPRVHLNNGATSIPPHHSNGTSTQNSHLLPTTVNTSTVNERETPAPQWSRRVVNIPDYSSDESEEVWEDHDAFPEAVVKPCSVETFRDMWRQVEVDLGNATIEIEQGKLVRAANFRVDSSVRQVAAMYGRIKAGATNRLFECLELDQARDVFLDFGHGIGNAVIQAAYTVGCNARGIEIDPDRYNVSMIYYERVQEVHQKLYCQRDNVTYNPGAIDLKLGGLEDTKNTDYLTKGGRMKAFCNNFNGVFGPKAVRVGSVFSLDDNLAGLFGLMAKGSILITLSKLNFVVPPRTQIAKKRHDAGLPEVVSPGFYEEDEVSLGALSESVSWAATHNHCELKGFRYRLVNDGSFVCWNPKCKNAQNGTKLKASRFDDGNEFWIQNFCSCGANSIMSLRRERKRPNKFQDAGW